MLTKTDGHPFTTSELVQLIRDTEPNTTFNEVLLDELCFQIDDCKAILKKFWDYRLRCSCNEDLGRRSFEDLVNITNIMIG